MPEIIESVTIEQNVGADLRVCLDIKNDQKQISGRTSAFVIDFGETGKVRPYGCRYNRF